MLGMIAALLTNIQNKKSQADLPIVEKCKCHWDWHVKNSKGNWVSFICRMLLGWVDDLEVQRILSRTKNSKHTVHGDLKWTMNTEWEAKTYKCHFFTNNRNIWSPAINNQNILWWELSHSSQTGCHKNNPTGLSHNPTGCHTKTQQAVTQSNRLSHNPTGCRTKTQQAVTQKHYKLSQSHPKSHPKCCYTTIQQAVT